MSTTLAVRGAAAVRSPSGAPGRPRRAGHLRLVPQWFLLPALAFYLVVVEDKGGDCGEWSGAWPVGFVRAGGDLGGTPSSAPPG